LPQDIPVYTKIKMNSTSEHIDKTYKLVSTSEVSSFALSPKNQESVNWAIQEIYSDSASRVFKEEWRTAFKSLARSAEYKSLQIEATRPLHERALGYMKTYGFSELRAYLFFFDIVVQNGSLRTTHFNQYLDYFNEHPEDSITENLLNLMEIRVSSSRPEFQNDVRSRKRTIILSEGLVHGSLRELPIEYCYNPLSLINNDELDLILN